MAKHTAKVIAVFGRTRRAGRWTICDHSIVVSFFGRCHLDLTKAITEDGTEDVSMTVVAIFGSVTIVVPAGSDVKPSGMAILASAGIDLPTTSEVSELVPLELEWTAVLGRVRVVEKLAQQPQPQADEAAPTVDLANEIPDTDETTAGRDVTQTDNLQSANDDVVSFPQQQSDPTPSWARFEISPEELAAAAHGVANARRSTDTDDPAVAEPPAAAGFDSASSPSETESDIEDPTMDETDSNEEQAVEPRSEPASA